MSQGAKTYLFNPLVLKANNSECQNQPFPLQIKPIKSFKASWRIIIFYTFGTNGLIKKNCSYLQIKIMLLL